MDDYRFGPVKTLVVADVSVPLLDADVKPTTGEYAGLTCEYGLLQAIGALYVETSGAAATTASFPMAAGDLLPIKGYQNITRLRFIRNAVTTSVVWIPGYR